MAHMSLFIMNMVGSECSPCRLPLSALLLERAMLFRCVVHPKGLNPFQAAKAWHLRVRDGLAWKEVRAQVRTIKGAQSAAMIYSYKYTLARRAVIATFDLSAKSLCALKADHWLKNPLNVFQLHLREAVVA